MLKTAALPERSNSDKLEVGDNEGGNGVSGVEIAKKLRKSKGQKLSKSQKPAKPGKNLSKNGNAPNFNTKDGGPSFLTPDARKAFNRLRLVFTKASILWHFNPEYHIWIKINTFG